MPLTFVEILEYLRMLGQRHIDVKTSEVALPDAFGSLPIEKYPAVFVEPDPMAEEVQAGADLYSFAVQFLVNTAENTTAARPALVSAAKVLADEYRQQLEDDQVLGTLTRKPTFTLMYGTANTDLASGVRMEFGLTIGKMPNRNANRSKFTPRVP